MNLPPELWLKISEYTNKRDLKALLTVNKRFFRLLRPNLYRNIFLNLNSFQLFCQNVVNSALENDLQNENFIKILKDLSLQESQEAHETLQEIMMLIQNQDHHLHSLLQRISEPLDLDVDFALNSEGKKLQKQPLYSQGYGKFVKNLSIPSDGFNLKFLKILQFMPNLKKVTFYHPPHDEKWIPFLKPKVLESIASNFQSLQSLIIEDLSKIVFKPLINLLSHYGSHLLHLTIEASGELEPFFTTKGVLDVLSQNLPNLKALRLDGIPSGSDDAILNLVNNCTKLECIVLDYCFGITMESVSIIWNGLNNLKFLGFAGLNGALTSALVKKQCLLETLRFVDCAVTDDLVIFTNLNPVSKLDASLF